jgi:hypothetical protein
MKDFYLLQQRSVHLSQPEKRAGCTDCHLPTDVLPKSIYKIRSGAKDIYKTAVSETLDINHFNDVPEKRHVFVFKKACLKCHIAGIVRKTLPGNTSEIHRHAAGSGTRMHCVDCHGGMEHGRSAQFDWEKIKIFIHAEKVGELKNSAADLTHMVTRYCIACHLRGGKVYGSFEGFNLRIQPSDYLTLKVGIRRYDMPPTPSLRKEAVEYLAELEKRIE